MFDVSSSGAATLLLENQAGVLCGFLFGFVFFPLFSDILDVPSLEHLGPPKNVMFPSVSSRISMNIFFFCPSFHGAEETGPNFHRFPCQLILEGSIGQQDKHRVRVDLVTVSTERLVQPLSRTSKKFGFVLSPGNLL